MDRDYVSEIGLFLAVMGSMAAVVVWVHSKFENLRDRVYGEIQSEIKRTDGIRSENVAELHRRIDRMKQDHADFREAVPQRYATMEQMRESEQRMLAAVSGSEHRIISRLDKFEEKLDRVRVP